MLALGVYPAVSLAAAREKRDEARRNVAAGVDPVKAKNHVAAAVANSITFKDIAIEWHEFKKPRWSSGYASDILEALNKDIFPAVGKLPVAEIEPVQMLTALRKIENRGATESGKNSPVVRRGIQLCSCDRACEVQSRQRTEQCNDRP